MTDHSAPADPGVEATVARPGGVSYLGMPAQDVAQSADFYRAVFGWQYAAHRTSRASATAPATSSDTGPPTCPPPGKPESGPTSTSPSLDDALRAAAGHGAELVTPPYPEGNLWIATIRDPAGNVIGIWPPPGQMRAPDVGNSAPCLVREWQVLASPGVG